MKDIRAITGMHDILPDDSRQWQRVEAEAAAVLRAHGYREVRLPLVEQTALFSRAIGDVTDIVEKEMYSFPDRDGTSLTLRPEGTAGCVRAAIQHGLLNTVQRFWYAGPMFRRERPQHGRQRQFHQIGAEIFGNPAADAEAELLLMGERLWRRLGIEGGIELQLNTLGESAARVAYRDALVEFLRDVADDLDEDSRRRLETNPLRILDSKSETTQALLEKAPDMADHLDAESAEHFDRLRELLDATGVEYRVNRRMVRGLDYYNRTVFEWVTDTLGAQGTVCGGGRYDGLVQQLGGKRPTPGAGFAMGLERLLLMMQQSGQHEKAPLADVYIVAVGNAAQTAAFRIAEQLRNGAGTEQLPQLTVVVHSGGGSFKSQMKHADKSGAAYAVILGEDEVEKQTAGIKPLRRKNTQFSVPFNEIVDTIEGLLRKC